MVNQCRYHDGPTMTFPEREVCGEINSSPHYIVLTALQVRSMIMVDLKTYYENSKYKSVSVITNIFAARSCL